MGRKAKGVCDRCGFVYKLRELRHETVNERKTNLKVCETCWDEDHPQLRLGRYPVHDPQALRDPRPDTGKATSRAKIYPVTSVKARVQVGQVTVSLP